MRSRSAVTAATWISRSEGHRAVGTWTDPQTFLLERDEIANNGALLVTMHFQGDQVDMEVRERTVEAAVSLTGTVSGGG